MKLPYIKVFGDLSATIDLLSDAEAGRLLKSLMHYINDQEDELLGQEKLVFAMLRAQIDRDAASYAAYTDKQRTNGQKGGRPRKPKETQQNPENPSLFAKTQKSQDKEKEEEEDKEKEKDSGGVTREDAPPPLPYGLTDSDITESMERDRLLEQTARECGLPTAPANMMTARDLADEHTTDTVILAMRRAADGKSQTWGYVKGILRRWREQGGIDTPQRKQPDRRPAAAAYTQREYTEAQLNTGTDALLREAMEVGA